MAQLRDARTSEIIAISEPAALVLLADELGRENILFDDVGVEFDPDAVLEAHNANLESMSKLARSQAKGVTADDRKIAKEHVERLESLGSLAKRADDAKKIIDSAQDRNVPTLPPLTTE
jgi:hypothetical protein